MMRFDFFKKRKEEPVKVLELFGGIGACTQAFKRVGIPFEVVDYVEIDKYACKSYNAINGTDFKPQDICEWDKDIKVDFIMHGSPCQDFSVAGKGLGGDEGSGTRSSLMYETIRIVEKLKPKYVLWENVKNVTGKKHRHNFDKYLVSLQQLGYNNYWQIMNAKDYGIPQNRERVFVLSIRRDIDNGYEFPEPFPLKLRLKDMLDAEVDEKYYLNDRKKDLKGDEYLSRFSVEDLLKPVAVVVIFFGDGEWKGARTLHELLDWTDIPEAWKELFLDCRMHLIEVQKIENLELFHSDLKLLFGFLQSADCQGSCQ